MKWAPRSLITRAVMVIGSSDGRRRYVSMSYMPGINSSPAGEEETPIDPYNNDLYMSRVTLTPATGAPTAKAAVSAAPASIQRSSRNSHP